MEASDLKKGKLYLFTGSNFKILAKFIGIDDNGLSDRILYSFKVIKDYNNNWQNDTISYSFANKDLNETIKEYIPITEYLSNLRKKYKGE